MQEHFELSDQEFINQLRDTSLEASLFTHEAHLRLAWLYLRKYGRQSAAVKVDKDLFHYIESLGAADKYHKTVTIAAVKTVDHFMGKSKTSSFETLITEHPRLKHNFKELLLAHYSYDLFSSDLARKEYIKPDLLDYD